MTSGVFHLISLDEIVVERAQRQRRDINDVDTLADSIRRLGLIHPIVVTREHVLVSGERRYTACRSLGWASIPAQYTDELDPAALRAIELEENIKRQDISWQDQVRAVREYHALRAAQEPGWTQDRTAEAIGLSQQRTSALMLVGEELAKGNVRIVDAPKLSTAEGIVRRARERQNAEIFDRLKENLGVSDTILPGQVPESIVVADFTQWVLAHQAPRFNLIHCDFPYGIQADRFNQGSAPAHGGYDDTPEVWEALMQALEIATKRACAPSCHLMFWFAMRKGDARLYEPTARRLEQMGWDVNPMPLIWMKSDGAGIIPDPERGPRQIYETCFLGSRGDRKIVRSVANAYSAPTVRDRHMSEKPEPMLRHFFGMLVDENTVLLDPTCGSGSALRAAESLGARYVLGLEINSGFADLARDALDRARALKRASETVKETADG